MDNIRIDIKNGLPSGGNIVSFLQTLKDGSYVITAESTAHKTKNQLGYYYGALLPIIVEYTGYSKSDTDMIMKSEFLMPKEFTCNGRTYNVLPSLKEVKKVEMSKFIENVLEYMVDNNLNPPMI